MNWSDEHYVKLYTRDTLTWRSWGWKTRTLFLHLVRKLDGAGIIETGKMDPAQALALQLELPVEFVAEALPLLLADGTAELCAGGVLLPKFVEAQEARKTDRLRKADERQRTADKRRISKAIESTGGHVTPSHTASQPVTLQPSPAQPSLRVIVDSPAESEVQPASSDAFVDALALTWNETAPPECPRVKTLTEKRKTSAQARLKEVPDLGRWRAAIESMHDAPFLRGAKGWHANFDWLLQPNTLTKLEEGSYRGTAPPFASKPGAPQAPTLSTHEELTL